MKKATLTLAALVAVAAATQASAWGWPGRHGAVATNASPAYVGTCCPMNGAGAWRGRMGQGGMMNRTWMQGNWMCGAWEGYTSCPWDAVVYDNAGQLAEPLTQEQVEAMAEHYIARNPNLKIGQIESKDDVFIVDIVTRKGDELVDRVAIDRATGMMRPVE